MKIKIQLAIISIYILAFSNVLLDLMSLRELLGSYILLGVDLIVLYIGLSGMHKSKFNLIFFIALILLGFANFLSNDYSFITFLNGMREIVLVVLLFSFYESIRGIRSRVFMRKCMDRFILIFLVTQLPVTIFQFIEYGASDQVGGTLGNGNTGILTLLIIPMVYSRIKKNLRIKGAKAYYNLIFLLPLFINETKISFVLIPIMFFCLLRFRKIETVFMGIVLGIGLFSIMSYVYSDNGTSTRKSSGTAATIFSENNLDKILLSNVEEGEDIPRFTKIYMAMNLLNKNTIDFLIGEQIGAFKGGTTLSLSKFASQYNWMLLGSKPYIFFLLISGGWLMLVLMIFFFINKLFMMKHRAKDMKLIVLLASLFILILFYNDAFRNPLFCFIYIYFVMIAKELPISPYFKRNFRSNNGLKPFSKRAQVRTL